MLRGLVCRACRPGPRLLVLLHLSPAVTGGRLLPARAATTPSGGGGGLGLLTQLAPRTFCSSPAGCWRCGAAQPDPGPEPPDFFCPACQALQPPDRRLDYFRLLGAPRTFRLEPRRLREAHRRLQRALHPDRFGGSCPVQRRHSEQQSARLNEALAALLRPVSRGLYLLRLEGEGETETEAVAGGEAEAPDPAFLAAVLELNERLADGGEAEARAVWQQCDGRLRELGERVARAFERGRPREARPLLRRMQYWSSLSERARERLPPA